MYLLYYVWMQGQIKCYNEMRSLYVDYRNELSTVKLNLSPFPHYNQNPQIIWLAAIDFRLWHYYWFNNIQQLFWEENVKSKDIIIV